MFGSAFVPIRDGTRGIELKILTRWNESESVVDVILVLRANLRQRRDAFHLNKLLAVFFFFWKIESNRSLLNLTEKCFWEHMATTKKYPKQTRWPLFGGFLFSFCVCCNNW